MSKRRKKETTVAKAETPPRILGGERLRLTQDQQFGSYFSGLTLLAPPDSDSQWRDFSLDSHTLDRMSPAELMELLCDLSPDISKALWDFQLLSNPGWDAKAFRVGSEEVDKPAQALVDAFFTRLKTLYGSPDVPLNVLFFSAFLRGGFYAEIVLSKNGREALDLATPDPKWLRFRRVQDPERGQVWEPYQYIDGSPVSLAYETIRYVPIHPLPGKPYGRPLTSSALFVTLFSLGLLHDLRRVVAQQGYPRIDLAINSELLSKWMPPSIVNNEEEKRAWLASIVQQVKDAYGSLRPDDAYVHTDTVSVNKPVGAVDSSSLGAIDGLFRALERQMVRALKTIPLLMGINEAASETHANRQWEVHVAGIKALQHLCEGLLEHLLGVMLRAAGKQATVQFRFAELRASERLRDAQTEAQEQENAAFAYDRGWISQETAAERGAKVKKPDQDKPRVVKTAAPTPTSATDTGSVDPGANRHTRSNPHHDPHSGEFSSGGGTKGLGAGAEETPTRSQKSIIAQQTSRRVGADVQRYSEEHCEPILAKGLKQEGKSAMSLRDNEPVDVIRTHSGKITDGIELKTMTDNKNSKITMKADAVERKRKWQDDNHADFHTIVFDDHKIFNAHGEGKHGDDADRTIYYRRGYGSFRIANMHKVESMDELRTMIDTPHGDLPKAAQPPKNYVAYRSSPRLGSNGILVTA